MNAKFDLEIILESVCNHYGVEVDALIELNKRSGAVEARQVYCYLAEEFTECSFKKIGSLIERDHSTVIYSSNKIKFLKEIYPETRKLISEITSRLFNNYSLIPINIDLLNACENNGKLFTQ